MPLPLTRDHTAAAAAAVRANTWNKLQDMVVGAAMPTLDFPHPACDFEIGAGANPPLLGDGQWTVPVAPANVIQSSIVLAPGTRIVSVKFGYNRAGAGTLLFRLRKRDFAGGAAANIDTVSVVAGAAWATVSLITPYVVEPDMQVLIDVTLDNVAHIFGGAIVTVDRMVL